MKTSMNFDAGADDILLQPVADAPAIASRHLLKVYGNAAVGSPPMSAPHLDTRYLGGKQVLLFGPFAIFSTRFLKEGSYFDLVEYLADQLMLSQGDRMAALRADGQR